MAEDWDVRSVAKVGRDRPDEICREGKVFIAFLVRVRSDEVEPNDLNDIVFADFGERIIAGRLGNPLLVIPAESRCDDECRVEVEE